MKRILLLPLMFLVIFFSCEKTDDQSYTLKFYGDAYSDIGYSVAIASDGYIIAGQFTDLTRRDGNYIDKADINMGIIKVGWNGDPQWKVSAGGKYNDWGTKLYQLQDGSMLCIGTFTDTTYATPGNTDVFVVRLSKTGDVQWEKHYGGTGNQTGRDIIETDEGFMILGTTDLGRGDAADSLGNTAGNTDILFLRINGNGDLIDTPVAWGYQGNDVGKILKNDNHGAFIVLCSTDRSWPGQSGDNFLLLRINSVASVIEARIFGSPGDEYAGDMEVLDDGYIVTYNTGNPANGQATTLLRLSRNLYGTYTSTDVTVNGSSTVTSMCPYINGSFILAGGTGPASSSDMLVCEIDSEGNLIPGHSIVKGSSGIQVAYDVSAGDDGYIIAVGKNSYDVNSMITMLKFRF